MLWLTLVGMVAQLLDLLLGLCLVMIPHFIDEY